MVQLVESNSIPGAALLRSVILSRKEQSRHDKIFCLEVLVLDEVLR